MMTIEKDKTWNPVMGCSDRLGDPLRWRKPRRVFVNSTSDLFHDAVPDEFIDRVFAVMAMCPHHTFQVLTKRPERMRHYMAQEVVGQSKGFSYGDRIALMACDVLQGVSDRIGNEVARRTGLLRCQWPLPNVWLGVSCEDQRAADERIPILLQTPAAVRFVSCEPLIGPVDLTMVGAFHLLGGRVGQDVLDQRSQSINWVIVGGEIGPGARPCDVAWIRSIVRQCFRAEIACFVKQLGAHPIVDGRGARGFAMRQLDDGDYGHGDAHCLIRLRDRKGGDPAEWPNYLIVREFPEAQG